jgi:hypothetical protein
MLGIFKNPAYFILGLVTQGPLVFYLLSSAANPSAVVERGVQAVDVARVVFSAGCVFGSFMAFRKRVMSRLELFIVIVCLMLIPAGLIHSERPLLTFVVLANLILLMNFIWFCRRLCLKGMKKLLEALTILSVASLCVLGGVHYVFLDGDYLFTLTTIQLPCVVLSVIGLRVLGGLSTSVVFWLIVYSAQLAFGAYSALQAGAMRVQFTPVGVTVILIAIYLISKILKNAKHVIWFTLSALLGFLLYVGASSDSWLTEVFAPRVGSAVERQAIFYTMARDSFYFLVPQGLGASLQYFNISTYVGDLLSERVIYPPHSGVAVLLYDFGAVFFLGVFGAILAQICYHANYKGGERSVGSKGYMRAGIAFRGAVIRRDGWVLLTCCGLFWVIENSVYLKAVFGPDYFSDDFLMQFFLLVIIAVTVIQRPERPQRDGSPLNPS